MRYLTLCEGRLHLHEPGREPAEIESPFAREVAEREENRQERHGWKGRDREGAGPFSGKVVWGRQATGEGARHRPVIRFVTRGAHSDEIFYVVQMANSSGLFRRNLATGEEWRLFHKQDFDACGLSFDAPSGRIVVGTRGGDQVGKLQVVDENDRRRDTITSGDGHDTFPAFDAAEPDWILFQTSGVARDEDGHVVAFGPAEVHRIDPARGGHEELLVDDHWDFLSPRRSPDGALFFVRRPYRSRHAVSWTEHARAFVLFPFRLGLAVFGFLDAFSRIFARQPLRPTGGPDADPVPTKPRYATFLGEAVALEKVNRRLAKGDDSVHVVPASWELVRQAPDGGESVLARHVVAYDIGPDGTVVHSDGIRVFGTGHTAKAPGLVQAVVAL